MPPRNERQFNYLSYENLCLKNLSQIAWYTIFIITYQACEPCGFIMDMEWYRLRSCIKLTYNYCSLLI